MKNNVYKVVEVLFPNGMNGDPVRNAEYVEGRIDSVYRDAYQTIRRNWRHMDTIGNAPIQSFVEIYRGSDLFPANEVCMIAVGGNGNIGLVCKRGEKYIGTLLREAQE